MIEIYGCPMAENIMKQQKKYDEIQKKETSEILDDLIKSLEVISSRLAVNELSEHEVNVLKEAKKIAISKIKKVS